MKKKLIIMSIVTSLLLVGGAFAFVQTRSGDNGSAEFVSDEPEQRDVTKSELEAADGKDGKECLVAVDGMVYEIDPSLNWRDGEHTSSEGQAYCGADLSKAIDASPHGRSKLDTLTKVGRLTE